MSVLLMGKFIRSPKFCQGVTLSTGCYLPDTIPYLIEARRDDDHIHGALYYIPPQTLLGKGAGAPTEERTDYLTIDLLITRKKRAPL